MDPQCGWCYGNNENIESIYEIFNKDYQFEFLVGGMWLGENAPKGGDSLNQFIKANAPRMSEYTGAEVSEKFYELTKDESYAFSSLEPSAAIVLVKKLAPNFSFSFAKDVQKVMFIEGKRLDQLETYKPLLEKYTINISDFETAWMSEENLSETQAEFKKASAFANGFPTMILENENEEYFLLANGYFQKEEMIKKLNELK